MSRRCSPGRSWARRFVALLASGKPGSDLVASGLAANGSAAHAPGGYGKESAFTVEALLTGGFLVVILARPTPAPAPFAPLAIGLALTLIHLVSIPIDNTSVTPARSTGPARFMGGWALSQLWLFWAAPLAGEVAAGLAPPMAVRLRGAGPVPRPDQRHAHRAHGGHRAHRGELRASVGRQHAASGGGRRT